ncbi:hypothetical protein F5884DRAFT_748742 [Xylogone sp. PMI_703]|nr:hypothetical protein F5884DRAFT_748742 [Xylogone sp. PMI_703]
MSTAQLPDLKKHAISVFQSTLQIYDPSNGYKNLYNLEARPYSRHLNLTEFFNHDRLPSKEVESGGPRKIKVWLPDIVRHVKCDETKPACKNCTITGRRCDGYGVWNAPDGKAKNATSPRSPAKDKTPTRSSTPSMFPELSQEERICLDYYISRTVVKIPSVFDSPFWSQLVPQASAAHPAVLHAAIALGSAHRSVDLNLRGSQVRRYIKEGCHKKADRHEIFALGQYTKAIAYLRTHMTANNATSLQVILTACVLFISLDLLRGEYQTAFTHTRNGLKLLSQLQSPNSKESQHYTYQISDPKSTDGYLSEVFSCLNIQSALLNNTSCSLEDIQSSVTQIQDVEVPDKFQDGFEARRCFNTLMNNIMSLMRVSRFHDLSCDPYPKALYSHRDSLQSNIDSWIRIYNASQATLLDPVHKHKVLGGPLLRVFLSMASVMTSTLLADARESIFDSHTPDFTHIIQQTVDLWKSVTKILGLPLKADCRISGLQFTVDLGTIPFLYYTALKCRVPWLRRQAIALLLAAPHREGMWDGVIVANIAQKVMRMEENGFYDDLDINFEPYPFDSPAEWNERNLDRVPHLPESSRFYHIEVVMHDPLLGVGHLICKRRQHEMDGSWIKITSHFDFSKIERSSATGVDFD